MTIKIEQAARQALSALMLGGLLKKKQAITALREALAEQERKAKYDERFERLEKFEQAEQKPVAFIGQGLKPIVPEDLEKLRKHEPGTATLYDTSLYAAPVRTKYLTDEEIAEAVGSPLDEVYLADFRAVISADREKNNV